MLWQTVRQWMRLSSNGSGTTTTSSSNSSRNTTSNQVTPALPQPCSDLYDLVLDLDWPGVIAHVQANPQDAHFQEGDNWETPLYLACQWNPPLNVIQALIQANEEALEWTCREHRDIPLHLICRHAVTSVNMLQEFVTSKPQTVSCATKYGKTALHILWEYSRPDCMKESEVATAWTQQEHEQVLIFWQKVNVLVDALARSRQQAWPFRCTSADQSRHSNSENQAYHNHNNATHNNNNTTLYQVHALVSLGALGCPLGIFEFIICQQYPDQLAIRDETGQLPLHIAVGPPQWSPTHLRRYRPREQAIIQLLLRIYPQAARERWFSKRDHYDSAIGKRRLSSKNTLKDNQLQQQQQFYLKMDRRGRYPLHIALAHRHTWEGGVVDVFRAAPEILSTQDSVTGLYAFQLAAIPVQRNLKLDLSTIWQLCRQQPNLIEYNGAVRAAAPTFKESREGG